jgi:hypothetical protein
MFVAQLAPLQGNPIADLAGLVFILGFLLLLTAIPLAVIGFVLVIVIRYLLLQRAPKKTISEHEIEARLVQIRQLAREQRFQDGALLMWETFAIAGQSFLGVFRPPNQTARQFGVELMNRGDLDPTAINAIVTLFEKARYGKSPITITEFNDGLGGLHRFLQVATMAAPAQAGGPPEPGPPPGYPPSGPQS